MFFNKLSDKVLAYYMFSKVVDKGTNYYISRRGFPVGKHIDVLY